MPQSITEQLSREQQIAAIEKDWATNPRWKGIKRGYTAADVVRLRGSFPIEHTLARRGAEKLWNLVNICTMLRSHVQRDVYRREVIEYEPHLEGPGRIDRWSSHATGQGRRQSNLLVRLASCCGQQ